MAQYQRAEKKWAIRGLNLSRPADLLGDEFVPYIANMRALQFGALTNRPGMSAINASPLPFAISSIIRLNNYLPSASQSFARFINAGGRLYSDNNTHTAFTQRATGFFDDPLQFAIMRPLQSPEPWLYMSDLAKSGKARVDGTFYNMGIAPPQTPPYAQQAATSYKVISDFEATGAWAQGGTAGAITAVARIATTIAKIVWDTGTTGWATVQPTLQDESLQPGMLLIVNSGGGTVETVLVESVSDAVTTTTIAAIQYVTGTTGECTVQLTAPSDLLMRDSMLRLNSGGGNDEVVRVLSVTNGPDDIPSFCCVTVGTHVATESVTGLRSFRAYFASTHVATETLASNNLRSSITVGIGYISLAGALDLSTVNSRPITDDDIIHISIKLDDLTLLTEGRIAFDVDSATNDFTQNYYYWPFRANDLVPATTNAITALQANQRVIQRRQIGQTINYGNTKIYDSSGSFGDTDYGRAQRYGGIVYDPPAPPDPEDDASQTTTGASQWTELRIRVGDLMRYRVGSDTSRTLHDVAAIRVQIQGTGTIQLDVDAWWIGGTYGPDVNVGAPINYRYVYRSSLTGALSNPSPPQRSGILPHRQRVNGTVTASTDPQVDQIDIYRMGGALTSDDLGNPWYYVMSVPNNAPTFADDFGDDIVIRGRPIDFDNHQPFLDRDIPRSGVCSVVGTEATRVSGDTFSTSWPAGTIIIINNVPYSTFNSPASTTKLSLNENAGALTNVNWLIQAPRLLAQPLPAMWGPFGGGTFEPVVFACGSQNQPGHVFWTRPGNADANSQYGSLELTSPSEPLINGVIFRSQAFVFSSEALYILTPTIVAGELRFSGAKVAGSRGLYSRFALAVGDEGIFYMARDGIYLTSGGESVSLTDEALFPLFPHEGAAAVTTNTIAPPNFVFGKNTRLSYGESELYFDFIDTNAARVTLLYDIKLKGWFPYTYDPEIVCHYIEEGAGISSMLLGGADGVLYLSAGTQDAGVAIPCAAHTPWIDNGDPRSNKQWANGMLDYTGTPTVVVRADNAGTLLNTLALAAKSSRGQSILDFTQAIHRNLQLQISANSPLTLYGYSSEVVRVSVSELTEQRNAYAGSMVFPMYGSFYMAYIAHISTEDITWSITVDNAATPDIYTIPNGSGVYQKTWVIVQAKKGKVWDWSFTSADPFQIIVDQSIVKAKPWNSTGPYEDRQPFGDTT
jgi:hypothetical protein